MEKERKIKLLSVVALIVAVLGLTVAFAALSQTLTINGTANVEAASWDIHFENLSQGNPVGSMIINQEPTISGENDTYIGDYNVTIKKPGDSVTFTFDVKNSGTIDAKISSPVNLNPVCTSNSGVTDDESIVCDGLTYTLTYTDTKAPVSQNDVLTAGDTKNLTLTLGFDSTKVPSDDVTISNLGITLQYIQN